MSDLMLDRIDSRVAGSCQVCGTCDVCRKAMLRVGDWVIRKQEKRRNTALGPKSAEQRHRVRTLTLDALEALGLAPPREEPAAVVEVRNWARAMRARQIVEGERDADVAE